MQTSALIQEPSREVNHPAAGCLKRARVWFGGPLLPAPKKLWLSREVKAQTEAKPVFC